MSETSPKPGQLTAMISSTALDLPHHREAVYQACLDAGIFPIGMEHLPARDASGVQVSLEMVEKADIYLGIYAWRYGWTPEGYNISITEMEFDHAVARKSGGHLREILVFTAHEDHSFTKKDIETSEAAQQKLAAFKQKAANGRVRKEFVSAEELRRLAGDALREWLARNTSPQPAAPKAPPVVAAIPNNLPRQPFFFGRKPELARIAAAIAPGARGWGALIDGPGGIGKTALAIRAATLVPAGQFSRIIFLSAKERELTADGQRALGNFVLPGYLEMLNALARELDRRELTKSNESERTDVLLSALQGTNVLLVLDNLETLSGEGRDHLFAFLNRLPLGCSALVTSRRRADAGAVSVRLDRLEREAALDMMQELTGQYPELARTAEAERGQLYEQTGGNPLLIRWVAGQLGKGRYRTLPAALSLLRSPEAGNNPLAFVFGDLLDTFTPSETKVLAALTHFTLPVHLRHIAELAAVNEEAARGALADLSARALVIPDLEEQHFILVPLVADFLRQYRPEAVAETGSRLEKQVYALVVENGYRKHERFPILEANWAIIAAALPLFHASPNDRLQTVCDALRTFFDYSGRWDELLSLSQVAEKQALAMGAHVAAGWRAYDIGWIYYLRGNAREVLNCANRAASHWKTAKAGKREHAFAIRLQGIGHQLKTEILAAREAYEQALALYRSLNAESDDVAMALSDLAEAKRLSGDNAGAAQDYQVALRIAKARQHPEGIAIYTGNLAELALKQKNWAEAERLGQEALTLSKTIGRQELIASNNHYIASALQHQGKATEALPYAWRAVEIFAWLKSPDLAAAEKMLRACEDAATDQ